MIKVKQIMLSVGLVVLMGCGGGGSSCPGDSPLECPSGKCCQRGYPYSCGDGFCYQNGCPAGSPQIGICELKMAYDPTKVMSEVPVVSESEAGPSVQQADPTDVTDQDIAANN